MRLKLACERCDCGTLLSVGTTNWVPAFRPSPSERDEVPFVLCYGNGCSVLLAVGPGKFDSRMFGIRFEEWSDFSRTQF